LGKWIIPGGDHFITSLGLESPGDREEGEKEMLVQNTSDHKTTGRNCHE